MLVQCYAGLRNLVVLYVGAPDLRNLSMFRALGATGWFWLLMLIPYGMKHVPMRGEWRVLFCVLTVFCVPDQETLG